MDTHTLRGGLTIKEVCEQTKFIYRLRDAYNARAGNCQAWHVDHIIPLAEGGLHVPENLRLLPGGQNTSRWNHDDDEWHSDSEAREQEFLEAMKKEIEDESNIHRPHGK